MSEWIPHDGGPMPVDGVSEPEVRFGDGVEMGGVKASFWQGDGTEQDPDYWRWQGPEKIIAYRLETPNEDQ